MGAAELPDAVTTIWWSTVIVPAFTAISVARENGHPTKTTILLNVLTFLLTVYYYKSELDLCGKVLARLASTRPLLIIAVLLTAYVMHKYPHDPNRIVPALLISIWLRLIDRPYPMDESENLRRSVVAMANKAIGYDDAAKMYKPDLEKIRNNPYGKTRLVFACLTTYVVMKLAKLNGFSALNFKILMPSKISMPAMTMMAKKPKYDCDAE